MTTMDLQQPRSLDEATALLAQHGDDARIIAGGTAVVIMLKNRLIAPGVLVSLQNLDGLRAVDAAEDGGLRIGALASLSDVERAPQVQQRLPTLSAALHQVGNVRVRNAATIGGNLSEADYASDPPCVLLAARARVKATSASGTREIPLTEFFADFYQTTLRPDEVLTELIVPAQAPSVRSTYIKYVTRSSEDRPCIGVSAFVDVDGDGRCRDLRVAVGAAAATPQELESAEKLAVGQSITVELAKEIAEQYAQAIDPISDLRGSAWYRTQMVRVFVRDAILQAAQSSAEARNGV
jgi:carbon-monoxide dehydrogenase medium subunit